MSQLDAPVLGLRGFHKAMPEEQLTQQTLRDESFTVPLLKEILRRIADGFDAYNTSSFSSDEAVNQDAMFDYERLISRFADVSAYLVEYRIGWDFMKSICDVIYPLLCSITLAQRTTSMWTSVAHRLTSILSTKKAHVVPPFTIPWRPLCDLILEVVGEDRIQAQVPALGRDGSLFGKDTLNSLVEACSRYFDDQAFGELWGHLQPRMQRRGSEFILGLFCGLLPLHRCCSTPEQRQVASTVLDTLFEWYEGRFNVLFGFGFQICDIVYYLTNNSNIGLFDVTPYAERIFTLNLRMSGLRSDFVPTTHEGFGLPQLQVGVGHAAYFSPESLGNFKNTSIASAIIHSLPNDTANALWNQLRRFLRACETYTAASAASTKQSKAVAEWMWRATASLVQRVKAQQNATYPIPEAYMLSQKTIDTLVEILRQHVVERLYRTRGNSTELIRLIALSPLTMLPYLQTLVSQGASAGSQTSFPQVALSIIGLMARQAMHLDETKAVVKGLVLTQRDWVVECLEEVNGPNFINACDAMAGMSGLMPMDNIFEEEGSVALRITKALYKFVTVGSRDDHIASISFMLLFMFRACRPETLEEIAKYIVEELRTTPTSSVRIFLTSLSTFIPNKVMELYFPVFESVMVNPKSTLQEKSTHIEFFTTLSAGSIEVCLQFAKRWEACIMHMLLFITSSEMVKMSGQMIHCVIASLMLPRTNAAAVLPDELDEYGMYATLEPPQAMVRWILPTDESKFAAIDMFARLATWALRLLDDLQASTPELKKERDALGVQLFDHEEAYSVNSVRRGLARFLQVCVGDAGRLLLSASTAMSRLRSAADAVATNPAQVLDSMLSALSPASFVYPNVVAGAFIASPAAVSEMQERLSAASPAVLITSLLKAAADSEKADDAVSLQSFLTTIHMLHGISFSNGKGLRNVIATFKGDPAGLSKRRSNLYYIAAASAASLDVSAYMDRSELSPEGRAELLTSVEYYTNSPFVGVAKEARDILLLHLRQMTVAETSAFTDKVAAKLAEYLSSPHDITNNAIAEKNFMNSMIIASSLCATSTPSTIKILLTPFISGTIQLKCRPTVETKLEGLLGDLLKKMTRTDRTEDSDWLLEVIGKVTKQTFAMTPQKKVLFIELLHVLRLRRTDNAYKQKLVDFSLQSIHLFHRSDAALVLSSQSILNNVATSFFGTRTSQVIKDDSSAKYKEVLLANTKLKSVGAVVLPKEFDVVEAAKSVTINVYPDGSGNDEPTDARQWSLSQWREWLVLALRRLTVGDCSGNQFRSFTQFVSRIALLSNFAVVPAFLEAFHVTMAEYKQEGESIRRKESGAATSAFSLSRTIEYLMRMELERIEDGCSLSYAHDKVANAKLKQLCTEYIAKYGTFIEETFDYLCDATSMSTETFIEFVNVAPLDSEELKLRLLQKLTARVAGTSTFADPSNLQAAPSSAASPKSAKNLYRCFCFIVSLHSVGAYEGYTILDSNNFLLGFFENHYEAILAEGSRSSAIAQQLADQIGQLIARVMTFTFMWDSDLWPFTQGLIKRSEDLLKNLLAKSIEAMQASGDGHNNSSTAFMLSSTTSDMAVPVDQDIKVKAGDTCKFQVLLMIRLLSISTSQMLEDVFPEIVDWLHQAQRWVKDDILLADRLISLSRNFISRDINKKTAQDLVTLLCQILQDVSSKAKPAEGAEYEEEEEDEDENASPSPKLFGPKTPELETSTPPPEVLSPMLFSVSSPTPELIAKPSDIGLPPQQSIAADPSSGLFSPIAGTQDALPPALRNYPSKAAAAVVSNASSTRRIITMFTSMLHRTLFSNLHRIGKFAILQKCASAMTASLGSVAHTSKSNHTLVAKNAIAVLVRVSSDEQVSALINPYIEVLRAVGTVEGGLGKIARTDMEQLVQVKKAVHFLCAVVLAYPEQVPPFCGKILKVLAPFGNAPVAELKNAVSHMFKLWWRTHRERWDYEFKAKFTPAQQAVILEYWSSSSYYA